MHLDFGEKKIVEGYGLELVLKSKNNAKLFCRKKWLKISYALF